MPKQSSTPTESPPAVIIIGLPKLAHVMTKAGVSTLAVGLTEAEVNRATQAANSQTPVIVAHNNDATFDAWVAQFTANRLPITVVGGRSGPPVDTSASKVFVALGFNALAQVVRGYTIDGNPEVKRSTAQVDGPQPDWDPRFPSVSTPTTKRIWVIGACGGVGATSLAISLAQQAGSLDLDSVVVDFSHDGRATFDASYGNQNLPTITDARSARDPGKALITASDLRMARAAAKGATKFALLAAPFGGGNLGDDSQFIVNTHQRACQGRDLATIDVGRITYGSAIWELMCADARAGGWLLIVTRPDQFGVAAINRMLQLLSPASIPSNRILTVFNQTWPDGPNTDDLSQVIGPCRWLDPIATDRQIALTASQGRVLPDTTSLSTFCRHVVWMTTGVGQIEEQAKKRWLPTRR